MKFQLTFVLKHADEGVSYVHPGLQLPRIGWPTGKRRAAPVPRRSWVEIRKKEKASMKYAKRLAIPFLTLAVMALFAVSRAEDKLGSYQLLTTITVPGNLASGFDISWVDSASERYYLADRTTGSVDVVDAEHDQYLYSIGGFVGNKGSGKSGPDGVLVIHKEHQLWAGDGDSGKTSRRSWSTRS